MDSLVLELQRDALDSRVSISSLLLKAKVVATKLGLDTALQWIDAEISGYKSYDDIPEYRHVSTQIEAWNPYHGWQHIAIQHDGLREALTTEKMSDSVSAIEDLVERAKDGGKIGRAVEGEALELFHRRMPVKLHVESHISPTALQHILALVRERVLTWSLELEKQGVLGSGMSFSQEEKRQAERAPSIVNIGSIQNMAGSIGGSVEHQEIDAVQTAGGLRDRVANFLDEVHDATKGLPETETAQLNVAVGEVREALADPEQTDSMIKKTLRKLPAAAIAVGNYAIQAFVTTEVGKLIGSP